MNKPVVFLRTASVLTFIHAVLHTVGGVFGKVEPGRAAVAVAAMKANSFLFMGNMRNFWEFYRGMGLGVTIGLTTDALLMWLLSSLARREAARLRPMVAVLMAAYLAFAVNSYVYFFLFAVIVEVLIALSLAAAIATAKSADALAD
jgi:hypothetical protein